MASNSADSSLSSFKRTHTQLAMLYRLHTHHLCLLVLCSSLLTIFYLYNMGSSQTLLSVNYKVFGQVQGVFFRKFTKQKADQLGLVGWVRNERDRTVSGQVQGPEAKVVEMKVWLSHTGSPYSKIDLCQFTDERPIEQLEYTGFTINRG